MGEYSWNRGTASRQELNTYESRPWSLQSKNWHCYTAAAFAVMKIALLAGRSDQLWKTHSLSPHASNRLPSDVLFWSLVKCQRLVELRLETVTLFLANFRIGKLCYQESKQYGGTAKWTPMLGDFFQNVWFVLAMIYFIIFMLPSWIRVHYNSFYLI